MWRSHPGECGRSCRHLIIYPAQHVTILYIHGAIAIDGLSTSNYSYVSFLLVFLELVEARIGIGAICSFVLGHQILEQMRNIIF
jgi:hypothetical protein